MKNMLLYVVSNKDTFKFVEIIHKNDLYNIDDDQIAHQLTIDDIEKLLNVYKSLPLMMKLKCLFRGKRI